jgi:hypothetical protein
MLYETHWYVRRVLRTGVRQAYCATRCLLELDSSEEGIHACCDCFHRGACRLYGRDCDYHNHSAGHVSEDVPYISAEPDLCFDREWKMTQVAVQRAIVGQ